MGSNQTVAGLKLKAIQQYVDQFTFKSDRGGIETYFSLNNHNDYLTFKSDRGGIETEVSCNDHVHVSQVQIRPWRD